MRTSTGNSPAVVSRAATVAALKPRWAWQAGERLVHLLLFIAAASAILATVAIIVVLAADAFVFFGRVSPIEFYTGTVWSPVIEGLYGVLPLIVGSLLIAGGACLIGIPLGLAAAIYLREYAPERVRAVVKPTLEILAGIPSIVFAFFALLVIAPNLQDWFGATYFNAANGILVIGIMTIPLVSSLSEDALTAVPVELRDGALALGATRFEAVRRVTLPAALSGVIASFLLAFGRAVGETMVVLIAVGESPFLTTNIFGPMNTLAATIARFATGDLAEGSDLYLSLFAVGFTLFLVTFAINIVSEQLKVRFQEAYA